MDKYKSLIRDFTEHMSKDPSIECCGIVTKDYNYIPCKNLSPKPKESFILDPVELLKQGDNCWGIFHSHPSHFDYLPSEEDKNSAIYSQYKFIVGSLNGKFYQYWLNSLSYLEFKEFSEECLVC